MQPGGSDVSALIIMSLLAQSLLQGHRAVPQFGAALSALANVQLPWTFLNQRQQQQSSLSNLAVSLPRQQQQRQHCSNQATTAVSLLQQQQYQRHLQQLQHRSQRFHTSAAAHEKKLQDIMKLERLQHETADKVEEIWMTVRTAQFP